MKALAITDVGLEDISLLEIKELIGVKGRAVDSGVIFDFKKKEDLYLLGYKGQSLFKIIDLIDNFSVKKDLIGETKKKIKKVDFSKHLKKKQKFAVRCWYKGAEISRGEMESEVGSVIPGKVDLENPDVKFFVFVCGSEVYFGIDVFEKDLSEREYKIFSHPHSLKGPLAYGLVRLAGYDGKKVFLNCFCKSGEIGIEAALLGSGLAVNHFNKEKMGIDFDFSKFDKKTKKPKIHCVDGDARSLAATRKNAKIAGVHKFLQIARIGVEDLDVKFEEGSANGLACYLDKGEAGKIKELFYQANYILKGKLVICFRGDYELDKRAKEYKFEKVEERAVKRGKAEFKVAVFKK